MKSWLPIFVGMLLFSVRINSQENVVTKGKLFKILKESIRQDSRTRISTNSNPWVVCNEDSAYYKSDTLYLYRYSNNYPKCFCNCYVDWTFFKKDEFILTKEYTDEPRRVEFGRKTQYFKIKVWKDSRGLVMSTNENGYALDEFKVVSIGNVIVLKRLTTSM
jgi:hypothetical protein